MTYYKFKCPYCKAVVGRENSFTKDSYGCPLRTCPKCGKVYIDKYCKEPALKPYKAKKLINCAVGSIFSGINTIVIVFIICLLIKYFVIDYSLILYLCVSIIAGIIYSIFDFTYQKKNLKNFNDKSLKLWNESDTRLQNSEYAKILSSAGFKVPSKYLNETTHQNS